MHIALIVPGYFPEIYGGAERQAELLARALAAQGARVTIVAPCVRSASAEVETDFGAILTVRLRDYPNFGGRRLGSTVSWTFRVLRWGLKRRRDIDAVYVFHARLHALAGLMLKTVLGKPLFIKLGGGGAVSDFKALEAKRGLYGKLVGRLLRHRTDGFVANSREIVGDLRACGVPAERIIEISNGVDAPARQVFDACQASRSGGRFLYTGRIEPDKNVPAIVEALARCIAKGISADLTIVGAGSDLDTVADTARHLGVDEYVHMPGRQDDMRPYLMQSDFFVSASLAEGQSNSLLEAMAYGLIPVVAAASGVRDLVSDGKSGLLTEHGDAESLSLLMERAVALSANQRTEMAKAAYGHIVAHFAIDGVATRTLAAISNSTQASDEGHRRV